MYLGVGSRIESNGGKAREGKEIIGKRGRCFARELEPYFARGIKTLAQLRISCLPKSPRSPL